MFKNLRWKLEYWFSYLMATGCRIDAWMFENQGRYDLAVDADCQAYEWERRMQDLQLFRRT